MITITCWILWIPTRSGVAVCRLAVARPIDTETMSAHPTSATATARGMRGECKEPARVFLRGKRRRTALSTVLTTVTFTQRSLTTVPMRNLMLGSSAAADVAVELSQLSWALKLLICDGEVTGSVLREPRATVLAEDFIR